MPEHGAPADPMSGRGYALVGEAKKLDAVDSPLYKCRSVRVRRAPVVMFCARFMSERQPRQDSPVSATACTSAGGVSPWYGVGPVAV